MHSSALIEESVADSGAWFRGFEPVASARVALAYSRSVEGHRAGQVYKVL